ncbi:MAG: molybdate ABC transporter substrate-binding protein [Chloroflexi bacterium]|nr:molybdate ABC transporter substrate-binding protein [Chloroflexota bacterium]
MRRSSAWRALLAVAATAALAGCAAPGPGLVVGAASSLEPSLRAFADAFEAETGVRVTLLPAASGTIARQIEEGAPIDVFASADPAYMERLAAGGFVEPGSVRSFGEGSLVMVATVGRSETVDWSTPLRGDESVRFVAIANPRTAPYGAAAVEALKGAGLWEALEPKVVYGESVAQALQFVRTGNADVGLVAASLVHDGLADGLAVYEVEPGLYEPIAEQVGIVSASEHRELAERFVEALAAWSRTAGE